MERQEMEKSPSIDDSSHLNRNRSFKSKQLVRSQAIRETQSPPRTISPSVNERNANCVEHNASCVERSASGVERNASGVERNASGVERNTGCSERNVSDRTLDDNASDTSSHSARNYSVSDSVDDGKKHHVEIQITSGAWEQDHHDEHRQRTRRWLGAQNEARDLLSKNPRVACVCGPCTHCPHCRRRKNTCPLKQDSGISCSVDCPDCSDTEGAPNCEHLRKSNDDIESNEQICRCSERREKPKNNLSKSDSVEDKTDLAGPDLVNFIKATLNKNPKDRATLLKIEKELYSLVTDSGRCVVRFPVMTSYGRMLVHRCAALFQLSHHLDTNHKGSVLVSKTGTAGGRVPCTNFNKWCTVNFPPSPHHVQHDITQAKSILKRDAHSLDDCASGGVGGSAARSKSLEQREKEYERVRRRIFSSDNCTQDESQWPYFTGPVKLLTPDTGRNKLLKVQSLETSTGPPPQSWRNKGPVSKSHSFGGYGQEKAAPRLLSRQGDLASSSWRLSPSSSGYKTLSLRSTDSVTPSPTGGVSPEPAGTGADSGPALVWAVTDLSAVPAGALIIHPQTGRPLTNPDGTVYRYDPCNPPLVYAQPTLEQDKDDQTNEKRRGRLEKQNSFIDNDGDSSPTDEGRSKNCCCDCRRVDSKCQNRTCDKPSQEQIPTSPVKVQNQVQQSPVKTKHEVNNPTEAVEETNHVPPYEQPTNQRPVEIETTNQRAPLEIAPQEIENGGQYAQQAYVQYNHEEATSPQSHMNQSGYMQQEALKTTPLPIHDNNMRPLSLTGMVYQSGVPQAYAYSNQCRMEQTLPPPIYQPVAPPAGDEPKLQQHESHSEPTFRIDASYPYAPVEPYANFAPQCATACAIDPTGHRSYGVTYGQPVEQPVMPAAYPIGNVILQQPMQQYQYQPIQWQTVPQILAPPAIQSNCATPIQKPTSPPNLYLPPPEIPLTYHPQVYKPEIYQSQPVYPMMQYPTYQYPQTCVIPQVIQQPYQICQPIYPMLERQDRRNSFKFSRNLTPQENQEDRIDQKRFLKQHSFSEIQDRRRNFVRNNSARSDNSLSRQNSNELALKIQQIKEQMAAMSAQEKDGVRTEKRSPEEFKGKRNNGNGILGSYPVQNNYGGRVGRPMNDESQLSTAARAIVNSIRNMQVKQNVSAHQEHYRRNQDHHTGYHNRDYHGYQKSEYYHKSENYQNGRNRRPEEKKEYEQADEKSGTDEKGNVERPRSETGTVSRNRAGNPMGPFPYRQPYVIKQMSPANWCRRSPGPVPSGMNLPRRPPPDTRNQRRQ